jgi:hypothetical protein
MRTTTSFGVGYLAVALCAVAAVVVMAGSTHLYLDDAFIHLRIARNLAEKGFYSFNGDTPTYSTSSPLYTLLLAVLWPIWPSTVLPKAVGVIGYIGLWGIAAGVARTSGNSLVRRLAILWLIPLSSPLAIRWLTDGMETSGAALVSTALGMTVVLATPVSGGYRPWSLITVFGLAALAVALRIELAFLCALGCFALGAERLVDRPVQDHGAWRASLVLVIGAALSLALVRVHFGSLLPDTAIAKAGGGRAVDVLVNSAKAHAAASMFGIGTVAVWLSSLIAALQRGLRRTLVITMNSGLLVFIAMAAIRHQEVQGYRYFVPLECFLIGFNIGILQLRPPSAAARLHFHSMPQRTQRIYGSVAGLLVVCWWLFDWHRLQIVNDGRATTYETFRRLDLSDLSERSGLAWDVGMIGYFSGGRILDANGLVNGREMAAEPYTQRLQQLTDQRVDFVFANRQQQDQISKLLRGGSWILRASFEFPNLSGDPDTHYLLVRR